jgi:hypothetical protein
LNVVVPLRLNRAAAENFIAPRERHDRQHRLGSGARPTAAHTVAPADRILNQTVLVRLRNHNYEGMDHDSIRTS